MAGSRVGHGCGAGNGGAGTGRRPGDLRRSEPQDALDEIAAGWAKDSGKEVPKITYAASSALAKQIEQGAPAELFFSADLDWMDYVARGT